MTLDRLSGGRLVLGVGLGSDQFAQEFVATGEETDGRRRARMLDEALDIVTGAWSGGTVQHRGDHYVVDGIRFLPGPAQTPGVPVWVAGTAGAARPLQRAARYDGYVPIELSSPDQLAEAVAEIAELRSAAGTDADRALRRGRRAAGRHRPRAVRRCGGDVVAAGAATRTSSRLPRSAALIRQRPSKSGLSTT